MNIFGLTFLLYVIKWSDGAGFWNNYRNTEIDSYRKASKTQRIQKKLVRCEQAIKFLKQCRDANVFPKFTRWKMINGKTEKIKSKYRRRILLDEIRNKIKLVRKLMEELQIANVLLYENMTYIEKWMVKHSLEVVTKNEEKAVQKRHDKKFKNLVKEKNEVEGTTNNPNQTIWNFSSHALENEEYETLQYGLKHGIANRAKDEEILAAAEALWDQIETKNLCKQGNNYVRQAKNCIRAMAFNLIYIDNQQMYKDAKKVKIIQDLKEKVVLLSPDKGNGVVIMDRKDYVESMEALFADRTKFRIIKEDPTHSRMSILQNYIRMLKKTGQIDDQQYKMMYPKNAKIG